MNSAELWKAFDLAWDDENADIYTCERIGELIYLSEMNKPTNKAIAFRPTKDAADALEYLLKHYRKEFQGIKKSDIINRAILTLAASVVEQGKKK